MRLSVFLCVLLTTASCTALSPVAPPTGGPWRFSGTVVEIVGTGTVAPVAGAQLTVVNGVNLNATTKSDSSGRYVFDALQSGRFTVSITAPGRAGISPVVDLFRDIEADFALKPQ
jgi:hypothetical protein